MRGDPPEITGMFRPWHMGADIRMARLAIGMVFSVMRSNKPKASSLPYRTQDLQVPVRDGSSVPARIYTPKRPSQRGCPCMYVCHAGDYILGEFDSEEWLCAAFASLGGIAVDVLYRHAPEHVFPVPVYDSYDGLRWVRTSRRRAPWSSGMSW